MNSSWVLRAFYVPPMCLLCGNYISTENQRIARMNHTELQVADSHPQG